MLNESKSFIYWLPFKLVVIKHFVFLLQFFFLYLFCYSCRTFLFVYLYLMYSKWKFKSFSSTFFFSFALSHCVVLFSLVSYCKLSTKTTVISFWRGGKQNEIICVLTVKKKMYKIMRLKISKMYNVKNRIKRTEIFSSGA